MYTLLRISFFSWWYKNEIRGKNWWFFFLKLFQHFPPAAIDKLMKQGVSANAKKIPKTLYSWVKNATTLIKYICCDKKLPNVEICENCLTSGAVDSMPSVWMNESALAILYEFYDSFEYKEPLQFCMNLWFI